MPEAADRRFVTGWLPPVRSPGPAGPLADTFLDATHGPFVHAATIGAADQAEVAPDVGHDEPGGFSSVQEQWCDNPVDPEVATGGRPLRQRRRTTYTYRAPFQLRLRQEFLDSGATTTILYLLQPEDLDSTRIYVCLLLSAGPGQPLPTPADGGRGRWRCSSRSSRRTCARRRRWPCPGCRWTCATRCTCPPTGSGVALRQALCDFMAVGRSGSRRPPDGQSSGSSAPQAGQRVGGSSSASRPQAGQTRRAQQAGSPPSSSGVGLSRRPVGPSAARPM